VTADVLDALDWHGVRCQSPLGCDRRASAVLHVHIVDDCDGEDTDADGNFVSLLCSEHAVGLQAAAAQDVLNYRRYGRTLCLTCGAPMAAVADVVQQIRTLA
jgi:hypothetical protein